MHIIVLLAIACVGGGAGAARSGFGFGLALRHRRVFGFVNVAIPATGFCFDLTPGALFRDGLALMRRLSLCRCTLRRRAYEQEKRDYKTCKHAILVYFSTLAALQDN